MPNPSFEPSLRGSEPRSGERRPVVHVPEAPVSSALLRLVRVHALLGAKLFAEIGLVPPQELILLRLEEYGPLPQSDIVGFLQRDRSTISATLHAMECAGLISRRPLRTDRRALHVSITDAGRSLCPAARSVWAELERTAFSHLAADARANLIDAMSTARDVLAASFDEYVRPSVARGRQT